MTGERPTVEPDSHPLHIIIDVCWYDGKELFRKRLDSGYAGTARDQRLLPSRCIWEGGAKLARTKLASLTNVKGILNDDPLAPGTTIAFVGVTLKACERIQRGQDSLIL
jgi:hypothetical protein